MVDGTKFQISCQRLRLLRKASHGHLIQNSAPCTNMWRQCDVRMATIVCNKEMDIAFSRDKLKIC